MILHVIYIYKYICIYTLQVRISKVHKNYKKVGFGTSVYLLTM